MRVWPVGMGTSMTLDMSGFHDPHQVDILQTHGVGHYSEPYLEIYDVPMKFAHKLIHGGPVHLCHRPL